MTNINPNIMGMLYQTVDDSGENMVWVRMTPQEKKFAMICQDLVDDGMIPGPTVLSLALGRGRDNNLHGNFSKIRRAVFLGVGLVKDEASDRWVRPQSSVPARRAQVSHARYIHECSLVHPHTH